MPCADAQHRGVQAPLALSIAAGKTEAVNRWQHVISIAQLSAGLRAIASSSRRVLMDTICTMLQPFATSLR
jgi:hypothetical protein